MTTSPVLAEGISLRQAAVVTGLGYLLMPAALAEFALYPQLVIPGDIGQTIQLIAAHGGRLVGVIFCYLATFLLDLVIAWALYYLLAPVNRSLSLLCAWIRIVYIAGAIAALFPLVAVYRILHTPGYAGLFGPTALQAQVSLLLDSFRWEWSMSLIVFAFHLLLLGWLTFRSGYIPRILGFLLVVDGLGWLADGLKPYLYPDAHIGWVFLTFFGELVFMLWLLLRGWKIPDLPTQAR